MWMNVALVASLCNWRFKDLSMSHDEKVNMLLPPNGEVPFFYQGVVFKAQI